MGINNKVELRFVHYRSPRAHDKRGGEILVFPGKEITAKESQYGELV